MVEQPRLAPSLELANTADATLKSYLIKTCSCSPFAIVLVVRGILMTVT